MIAPYPQNEAERLLWLRQSRLLDTPPEDAFDDLTRLAAKVCGVPIAAVSLLDGERQWFKSVFGLPLTETPREDAFCAHAILQPDVMVVPDATKDDRFRDNPLVTDGPSIRFYAAAPLLTSGGLALGSLCVIDRVPRQITEQQQAVLEVLARQVAGRIELQRQLALQNDMIAEQARLTDQRELAEASAVAEREFTHALLESLQEGIVACDAQGILTLFNRAARELHGLPEQPLPPEAWAEHFDLFMADGITPMPTRQIPLLRALNGEVVRETEMVIAPKDGPARTLLASGQAIVAPTGMRLGAVVAMQDVTERKQAVQAQRAAERDYRSLFENAVEGIFRTSPEGKYLQANPALAHIYGYETPEALVSGLTDIGDQLYVDKGRRAQFQRLMWEQGEVSGFESRVYRKDGHVIWISESARPVRDATGELCWYEGSTQDISERKARDGDQARALREAEERADRDPLTGLLNHRAFHRRLEEEADRAQRDGTSLAVVMLDLDNFKFFNDAYGHVLGDQVLLQVADRLRATCRSYDTLARFGGDEFALVLSGIGGASRGEIETRLRADLGGLLCHPAEGASGIPIGVSVGVCLFPGDAAERGEALEQADARLRRAKTGGAVDTEADRVRLSAQGEVNGYSMLDALVTAVDNKDKYTRQHSEDVMGYSLMIARELRLDEVEQRTIAVSALLHDVGKIGVPDAILRKPGKLTEEEFNAVRQHPTMGAALVSTVTGLEAMLDAVRHHHERWDGGGYPLGLKGDETPLMARLMAVADAFSAMTTDRPYRQGMSTEKALAILTEGAGTQWDSGCVEAFLHAWSDHESKTGIESKEIIV